MKILFIDFTLPYLLKDTNYPVGGWAIQLNAWIHGLLANGHQVGVLTWKGANDFVNKKLDFDLIETYDPDRGIKIVKYFYNYIPSLYRKAVRYKPDVITQACAGLNTGIMAFIAGRLNIPFIYRCTSNIASHTCNIDRLLKYELRAYRYGLTKTDVILCQNKYQYERFKKQFPEKTLHILHNPFVRDSDIEISPYENRKHIAWLGVFKREKNLPLLYEIVKKCPDITFKIAGMSANRMDSDTEVALARLKKLSNVEFAGYLPRKQVPRFLSKAVALLNTSHYEGFSNTFLEAFSVGTPVIAPEKVDPDYIIAENKLGISVRNNSDFPELIKNLYDDKSRFNEISERCQEYVYKNHDPKVLAERFDKVISGVRR